MMVQIHYPIGHGGTDAGLRCAINDHAFKHSLAGLVRRRTVGRQTRRMTASIIPALHHGQGRWQSVPPWMLNEIRHW